MESILDLARRLMQLEQRVDAYEKLYEDEMDTIRDSLASQRRQLLSLLSAYADGALVPDVSDAVGLDGGSEEGKTGENDNAT